MKFLDLNGVQVLWTRIKSEIQTVNDVIATAENPIPEGKTVKDLIDAASAAGSTNASNLSTLTGKVNKLIGSDADKSVRTIAAEEIAAQLIPENASEAYDSLQEIAAWIQSHPGDAAQMNQKIADLEGKFTDNKATAAVTADKLGTNAGSATKAVYFEGGIPKACTYSVNKDVPSSAVFTDTKVTAVGNHYKPSTTGATAATASAGSAVSAGGAVITKVNIDAAGHVTGVTTGTIPAAPTAAGLGAVTAVSASGTLPLTLSASKSGTSVSITGSVAEMTGATAEVDGKAGIVPAPTMAQKGMFLKGDGTWGTPTNTTYSAATSSNLGLVKLFSDTAQSVAAAAVTSTAGRTYGVQKNASGQLVVNIPWTNTTYNPVSSTANGLMTSDDKNKLDGIAEGATANTGTVTSITAGAGLAGGSITTSGTIKVNLNSEEKIGAIAAASKIYAVALDANGKLAVNVPWTDTKYTLPATVPTSVTATGTAPLSLSGSIASNKLTISGSMTKASATADGYMPKEQWMVAITETELNTIFNA